MANAQALQGRPCIQGRPASAVGPRSVVQTPRYRRTVAPRALLKPSPSSQHDSPGRAPAQPPAALALGAAPAPVHDLEGLRPIAGVRAGAAAPRLRVAVDVDEVLGRFVHALNGYCRDAYGMAYEVEDYWIYEYAKVWGCTQERSSHIVHEFFQSPHFQGGIPPIPGAAASLQRLSSWCDLVVVTSRQHVIQDATLDWLDTHYPDTFQEVYFGNHFALEGTSRKKSEICASVGASVLIDDNVGYAVECAARGIDVLLFDWEGGYPWSKQPKGTQHPNIQVVRNWREVEAALKALAVPAATAVSRI